jgi:predicted nucleic acid-binding protein
VAWHGIAETWAVLTRLPGSSVSAATAERLVSRIAEQIQPEPMSVKIYTGALRLCSDRGLRSGAIFDALHWAAAAEAEADLFLTFNPEDFVRLGNGAKMKVVIPPDPPSVRLPR